MRGPAFLWLLAFATLLAVSLSAFAQKPGQTPVPTDLVPLEKVIGEVQAALNAYQENRGMGVEALPPLTSAVFTFKTTVSEDKGGFLSFFVFMFGTSRQDAVTNDVTYTYSFPKPKDGAGVPPGPGIRSQEKKPVPLKEALAQTIQNAAKAVKTARTMGKLKFTKLSVSIQYGVTIKGAVEVSAPVTSFVVVGLSGAKASNTVQSVNLTFGE